MAKRPLATPKQPVVRRSTRELIKRPDGSLHPAFFIHQVRSLLGRSRLLRCRFLGRRLLRGGGLFLGLGLRSRGFLRRSLLGGRFFGLGLFLHRFLLGGRLLRGRLLGGLVIVVVMFVAAARAMNVTVIIGFDRGFQLLAGGFAVADLGLLEQEVDDLVLIKRRTQLGRGHRLVLDILHEALAVLRAILLRGLHHKALHFLGTHLDTIGLADFGQQQTEADTAHGDTAILVLVLFQLGKGRFLVFLMSRLMLKLGPDLGKFGFDHRRRNVEVVTLCQLVQQFPLHIGAGQAVMLLLDLALHQLAELIDAFEAKRFGELVVGLRLGLVENGRHLDVKGRRLALQALDIVVLGEGHFDDLFIAGLEADELILQVRGNLLRWRPTAGLTPLLLNQRALRALAYTRDDRGEVAETIDYMYGLFPILKERRHQLAGTMSGGEQQMLAIGRGLMAKPKLLLLDEPSWGVAPKLVTRILDTIQQINAQGVSILLVEQNLHKALAIAHHGYVIQTGRIVLSGSGSELMADEGVRKAYLGL